MNPGTSETPHEPSDIWQNVLARYELEEQLEGARPMLSRLAEAFAMADSGPHDPPEIRGVVEEFHVRLAADVLFALARTPEVYAKVGAPDLFVSLATKQATQVAAWIDQLESASFRCFLAEESIAYSQDWEEEIWHAVRVCRVFLPIVTPDWVASRWCHYELAAALALKKAVVPVVVGNVNAPPEVSRHQGFQVENVNDLNRLRDGQPSHWYRMLRDLRRRCYRDDGR
jgi:hypothetical protein